MAGCLVKRDLAHVTHCTTVTLLAPTPSPADFLRPCERVRERVTGIEPALSAWEGVTGHAVGCRFAGQHWSRRAVSDRQVRWITR
jgi:hypothetical protein